MAGLPARLAAFCIVVVLGACSFGADATPPLVDLTNREPLPAVAPEAVRPLRVAVAAVLSPTGNVDSYAELIDYLGDQLGRPAELVQRRTYAEVNALVASGEVDLAFVCTSAYVAGKARSEMDLLAVPEIGGESVYRSVLIVPSGSPAQSIADLEGSVFAFTDPMSHTGRVYPTYLVMASGRSPETFFSETIFTYGHDRAIQAVAGGVADGAAVDNLVLDYALQRDPTLLEQIEVIHRSPAFGIPPVVVPTDTSPQLRARLEAALLELHLDPDGSEILAHAGVDKFIAGDDTAYDGVRALVAETGIGG